jgi:hypothetical protein
MVTSPLAYGVTSHPVIKIGQSNIKLPAIQDLHLITEKNEHFKQFIARLHENDKDVLAIYLHDNDFQNARKPEYKQLISLCRFKHLPEKISDVDWETFRESLISSMNEKIANKTAIDVTKDLKNRIMKYEDKDFITTKMERIPVAVFTDKKNAVSVLFNMKYTGLQEYKKKSFTTTTEVLMIYVNGVVLNVLVRGDVTDKEFAWLKQTSQEVIDKILEVNA